MYKRQGKRERQAEASGGGAISGEAGSQGYCGGKLLSPDRRRCAVEHAREKHELSERHACRLVKQWRGTQRYLPIQRVAAVSGAMLGGPFGGFWLGATELKRKLLDYETLCAFWSERFAPHGGVRCV